MVFGPPCAMLTYGFTSATVATALVLSACNSVDETGVTVSSLKSTDILEDSCSIILHPDRFDGSVVSVRGYIFTDYRDFSGIVNAGCPQYRLPFGQVSTRAQGCEPLDAALGNIVQRPKGRVFATITGTVRYYPGRVPSVVIQTSRCSDVELEAN